jgi:hypothetical protein
MGPQPLPLSLSFPGGEVSNFSLPHALYMMCCLATGPKQQVHELMVDLQNCEPKSTFSLSKLISQVFGILIVG